MADSGPFSKFYAAMDKGQAVSIGDVLKANLKEFVVNEKFPASLFTQVASAASATPTQAATGGSGTASPSVASFVYLDVGAWYGSSDKWAKRRDFGVVCGPIVLLCGFSGVKIVDGKDGADSFAPTDDPGWLTAKALGGVALNSINALFSAINAKLGALGSVVVRRFAFAGTSTPKWGNDESKWVLHVILGDTHIGILDDETQTYDCAPNESVPTRKGNLMLSTTAGAIGATLYVPRYGRVLVRPLEELITTLVSDPNSSDGLEKILSFVEKANNLSDTSKAAILSGAGIGGLAAGPIMAAAGVDAALGVGLGTLAVIAARYAYYKGDVAQDRMEWDEAHDWWKYYMQGTADGKADKGKPANIFEQAGADFLAFVTGIGDYADNSKGMCAPQFHQLGDMLDFWVGFTVHFKPALPAFPAQITSGVNAIASDDDTITDNGRRAVQHWTKNIFTRTNNGKAVGTALDLASSKLQPHYLWGNHDNYLASFTPVRDDSGKNLDVRHQVFNNLGVFMEHGHAWDSSNSDNAPLLQAWLTKMITGTGDTQGVFLTQAAFIRPGPVRALEGVAAGVVSELSGSTFGERFVQLDGAVQRFKSQGDFDIYVMGHTHAALLTTISVESGALNPIEQYLANLAANPPSIECSDSSGNAITQDTVVDGVTQGSTWKNLMSVDGVDWISLEDPLAPGATYIGNLFGFVTKIAGSKTAATSSGILGNNMPPGRYEVRYYLLREQAEPTALDPNPFKKSLFKILVMGISMEGYDKPRGPDKQSGAGAITYTYDDGGNASIQDATVPVWPVVRWAFSLNPDDPDFADAWFALYEQSEADDTTRPGTSTTGTQRPWHATGKAFGRFSFHDDQLFMKFIDRKKFYQMRAFRTVNGQVQRVPFGEKAVARFFFAAASTAH